MDPVIVIPALGDNFAYLFRYEQNKAIAIDPADASLVLNEIKKHNLTLTAILATHHHYDHTAGIKQLQNKTNCPAIIGTQNSTDEHISDFDTCRVKTIPTPGHTLDSACFYIQPSESNNPVLFTGDTLFIAGCGRPMECDPETLWTSLQKLTTLPDNTLIYPGHNYTQENYEFTLTIDPKNKTIQTLLKEIKKQHPIQTVPSTIAKEKQTNLFLQATTPKTFIKLRTKKNLFG